jgi:hypothetical protein
MAMEILELRAYARAKAVYDRLGSMEADQRAAVLADPVVQWVREIAFELAQAALDARREAAEHMDG